MKITHEEPASGYSRMHVGDLKPGDVYVNGTHNPDRLNKGFALYMLLNASTSTFITCNADFRYAVNLRNGNIYQHETSMCVWLVNAETKFSIIKD